MEAMLKNISLVIAVIMSAFTFGLIVLAIVVSFFKKKPSYEENLQEFQPENELE